MFIATPTLPSAAAPAASGLTPSATPRWTLRQRVQCGALLLVAASVLVLGLAWQALQNLQRAEARSAHAAGLSLANEQVLRTVGELMLSQGSSTARQDTARAAKAVSGHVLDLGTRVAAARELRELWVTQLGAVDALLETRLIDPSDANSQRRYGELIAGMGSLRPHVDQLSKQAEAESHRALQAATLWLAGGLIGLALLCTLAGALALRALDQQLGGDPALARHISAQLAAGELDQPVPHDTLNKHSVMAALEHVRQRLLERRAVDDRVRYLAQHDTLSGALNRHSFNELLALSVQHSRSSGAGLAVLYIDLDHFKEVNDTLGHAQGDEVIRVVAQRLRGLLRRGDHLARLGGDEFSIVMHDVNQPQDVQQLAQRVRDELALPITLGVDVTRIGASVGIALLDDSVADDEDLLHKADLAMYRVKAEGRGQWGMYDDHLDGKLRARREMVRDLRAAIGTPQILLHYQPIYASCGQRLVGHEALLRWQHPVLGMVPPTQFVPLAEDSGLIDELGTWVLQEACREAATWPEPLAVSVNLSVAQLEHGDLVSTVARVLDQTHLPAKLLNLEITESMLMTNSNETVRTLQGLAAMGVGIVMDDFGTGYSSLAYLWRFQFDKLKIDRSFVADLQPDSRAHTVVQSIISLAHALGMKVTAEGIERPDQLAALQREHCDEMQGFLLGRPVPRTSTAEPAAPAISSSAAETLSV
jgi:diguanylate cyclase (GGDEF)-like protein